MTKTSMPSKIRMNVNPNRNIAMYIYICEHKYKYTCKFTYEYWHTVSQGYTFEHTDRKMHSKPVHTHVVLHESMGRNIDIHANTHVNEFSHTFKHGQTVDVYIDVDAYVNMSINISMAICVGVCVCINIYREIDSGFDVCCKVKVGPSCPTFSCGFKIFESDVEIDVVRCRVQLVLQILQILGM